jgi:hypothetical protein
MCLDVPPTHLPSFLDHLPALLVAIGFDQVLDEAHGVDLLMALRTAASSSVVSISM